VQMTQEGHERSALCAVSESEEAALRGIEERHRVAATHLQRVWRGCLGRRAVKRRRIRERARQTAEDGVWQQYLEQLAGTLRPLELPPPPTSGLSEALVPIKAPAPAVADTSSSRAASSHGTPYNPWAGHGNPPAAHAQPYAYAPQYPMAPPHSPMYPPASDEYDVFVEVAPGQFRPLPSWPAAPGPSPAPGPSIPLPPWLQGGPPALHPHRDSVMALLPPTSPAEFLPPLAIHQHPQGPR